jgi:hypothetical protein
LSNVPGPLDPLGQSVRLGSALAVALGVALAVALGAALAVALGVALAVALGAASVPFGSSFGHPVAKRTIAEASGAIAMFVFFHMTRTPAKVVTS